MSFFRDCFYIVATTCTSLKDKNQGETPGFKTVRLILCLLAWAVLPVFVQPLFAQTTVVINADKQFQYAEQLYSQKKFMLAIVEFERFVFLFPDDARVPESRYHIGMAYYSERQYSDAIRSFTELTETGVAGTDYHARAFFMTAESQLHLGRRLPALATLRNLVTLSNDINVRDEAYYRIAWVFLETAEWEKAQTYFQKISRQNQAKYHLADLIRDLEDAEDIHHKSPGVAGALAVLPGGGYLYCNRPRDALISFLLTGGLAFAAYEAFDNDMYALGGVISFVGIGFYSGNIYGSISSAHKYNRDRDRQFIDRLKENLKIGLSSRPASKGIELSLQYRF
jgi:tetratricopeptide (TPR) repeat protein